MYWLPLLFVLLLSACGDMRGPCGRFPYKLDIVQGNVLSDDQLNKLCVGMTRAQVRDLLGTPLLVGSMQEDRWVYYHVVSCGGKVMKQKNITIYFSGDTLERVDGFSLKNQQQ